MPGAPTPLPRPPKEDNQSLALIREKGNIYVDKTRFIRQMLMDDGHTFFCAKPRRFGKTLMVSTLQAFFQGKKELFRGLDIEEYMESPAFVERPVIRLQMNTIPSDEGISGFWDNFVFEISRIASGYGVSVQKESPTLAFKDLVFNIYNLYGPVALLIDEYDSQLANTIDNNNLHEEIRGALRSFYNTVKGYDSLEYFNFIFITGVSKFSKIGIFSAMNNLIDISFGKDYGTMYGYTEDEILFYFARHIEKIAERKSITQSELLENLRDYYDGYFFGDARNVYNPLSINKFLVTGRFAGYWIRTGSQDFITKYFSDKHVNVEDFDRVSIPYENIYTPGEISMELGAEFLLYQGGYLTVRIDDSRELNDDENNVTESIENSECAEKKNMLVDDELDSQDLRYYLTYPNHEVRAAMYLLVFHNYFNSLNDGKMLWNFKALLDAAEYARAFLQINEALKTIHHFDSSIAKRRKDGQWYYRSPISTFLYASGMVIDTEVPSTLGQADIIFKYKKKAYVIELATARGEKNSLKKLVEAMKQMVERKYGERYPDRLRIAIVIDEKERLMTHLCIGTKVYHIVEDALHSLGELPDIEAALAGTGRKAKR
jgi:hypothetical protein